MKARAWDRLRRTGGRTAAMLGVVGAAGLLRAAPLAAQSLERRVAEAGDGAVVFRFASRPGVVGCADGSISVDGGEDGWIRWRGRRSGECGPGPVRVRLDRRDGRLRDVDVRVGPSARGDLEGADLGTVGAPEAVDYLLGLARTELSGAAEDAVFPAVLADSVTVWPRLLELARERALDDDVRKSALFWVAQEAGDAVTEGIQDVAADESEDQDVREAAVFALSQRPDDEGVPALMEVARTARSGDTRRAALFWLAQSDDPGVVSFFEELLRDREPPGP